MLRAERLDLIVELVNKNDIMTIEDLMKAVGVSLATLRRDIDMLAADGRIEKTRGGVVSSHRQLVAEPSYRVKSVLNVEEKARIARYALGLIQDGDHIAMDSGSTCLELAKIMSSKKRLEIVTNDLSVAMELAKTKFNLIFAGGMIRKNYFASCGYFCEEVLKQIRVAKTFIAADGVDFQEGLMSYTPDDIGVKKLFIEMGREVILLCDHSKFEVTAYISVCPLSRIDKIITGKELSEAARKKLRDTDIELVLV